MLLMYREVFERLACWLSALCMYFKLKKNPDPSKVLSTLFIRQIYNLLTFAFLQVRHLPTAIISFTPIFLIGSVPSL